MIETVKTRISEWISTVSDGLREAEPDMPVEDRAADLWEPLIAVADAARGRWPRAARTAALVLSVENREADAERSLGTRLLSDIKELFDELTVPFMASTDLVERLRKMADAPWADLNLSAIRLASRLKEYGIKSGHNTAGTERGYQLAKFTDAFLRYLPS
jgi:hypothetical protein